MAYSLGGFLSIASPLMFPIIANAFSSTDFRRHNTSNSTPFVMHGKPRSQKYTPFYKKQNYKKLRHSVKGGLNPRWLTGRPTKG